MALLDDRGSPTLDETGGAVTRRSVIQRAETQLELTQRQLDTVDLIIQGATLRQVAERHDISIAEARHDYATAVALLNDSSVDRVLELREEVTLRERALILANMSRARAGDPKAAAIVQRADALLVEIWGLRHVKPELEEAPRDPAIAAAMEVFLAKAEESAGRPPRVGLAEVVRSRS